MGPVDITDVICYPLYQQETSWLELARFRREVYFKSLVSHYVQGFYRIQPKPIICQFDRYRRNKRFSGKHKSRKYPKDSRLLTRFIHRLLVKMRNRNLSPSKQNTNVFRGKLVNFLFLP